MGFDKQLKAKYAIFFFFLALRHDNLFQLVCETKEEFFEKHKNFNIARSNKRKKSEDRYLVKEANWERSSKSEKEK